MTITTTTLRWRDLWRRWRATRHLAHRSFPACPACGMPLTEAEQHGLRRECAECEGRDRTAEERDFETIRATRPDLTLIRTTPTGETHHYYVTRCGFRWIEPLLMHCQRIPSPAYYWHAADAFIATCPDCHRSVLRGAADVARMRRFDACEAATATATGSRPLRLAR